MTRRITVTLLYETLFLPYALYSSPNVKLVLHYNQCYMFLCSTFYCARFEFELFYFFTDSFKAILTHRPPSTTILPYANSLDPDDRRNSASHPNPCCLTLRQHFHIFWATLKHFENWSRPVKYSRRQFIWGLRVNYLLYTSQFRR